MTDHLDVSERSVITRKQCVLIGRQWFVVGPGCSGSPNSLPTIVPATDQSAPRLNGVRCSVHGQAGKPGYMAYHVPQSSITVMYPLYLLPAGAVALEATGCPR